MKVKKIPTRRCLGCNEHYPKTDLIRVVRSPEGDYSLDFTGKKSGRGAYICRKRECYEAARKNHGLERAFKTKLNAAIYDELAAALTAAEY